jgi:hypothetical protein
VEDFRWIGVAISGTNASLLTKMIQMLFGIAASYRFEIMAPSNEEWFEWRFPTRRKTPLESGTIITKLTSQIEFLARAKDCGQLNC